MTTTPSAQPATPRSQPTPAFPYWIEAKVGEGGMGVVYRATEPALGRTVAIKRLRPELLSATSPEVAAESRQRFLREARAAAAVSHPGIAAIYRVGEDESGPFIAMEWLDGTTLEALLQQGGLTPSALLRHSVALLETLDAAHRAGIVHRDIKPANLIVLHDGQLKVTDFGIAHVRHLDTFRTQAGVVFASPRFASPEQMLGDDVDGRGDIFAAGVVIYLALTGRFPFEGRDYAEVLTALLQRDPPAPSHLNARLPAALDGVVLRALHKRREDRYARASEMAAALRPFVSAAFDLPGLANTRPLDTVALASSSAEVLRGMPRDVVQLVERVVASWPARSLGRQPVRAILERLFERPLHADPFAGLVRFGSTLVLFHDGHLIGALDVASRRSGDDVLDSLPSSADSALCPVPPTLPAAVVPLLATLLGTPKVRHAELDSSFVSLPALARKLEAEGFDGLLRLRRAAATGLVLLSGGATLLTTFTEGWEDLPVAEPWETWITSVPVQVSVEEQNVPRLVFDLRRRFRDVEVRVDPLDHATPSRGAVLADLRAADTAQWAEDPAALCLEWALTALPRFLAERDRSARWRYLVEWLPLVRTARLHHELRRPDGQGTDFFDLVTFDQQAKVLHLFHYVPRGTQRNIREFIDRVSDAKKARLKSGDIGAAVLIAPHFEPNAIAAYRSAIVFEGRRRWGLEDAFTGYEGFVRIGPRRGFHLLLVVEREHGFDPILPD